MPGIPGGIHWLQEGEISGSFQWGHGPSPTRVPSTLPEQVQQDRPMFPSITTTDYLAR